MRRPGLYLFAAMLTVICLALPTTLAFAKTDKNKTIVTYPSAFAVSPAVADMPVDISMNPFQEMPEPRPNPNKVSGPALTEDPVLQKEALEPLAIVKGLDFDGIAANGFAPSDSNMAVGPNHIVEGVNIELAIYNKTGTLLSGPTSFHTFFSALGGNCANGASDPIVLYDRAADRWLISDIGYTGAAPFLECVGVSKTNDPTGSYFLYSFSFGNNLNDYPKLSTWATASNSAYLATYDIFVNGAFFGGSDLCGLDRTKMLAGNPSPAQLCQETPSSEFSYLPSDMDGPTPPVDGTPGLFIHPQGPNQLFLRKLTLNFAAGTSSLSAATKITTASFSEACHSSCVPQSGGGSALDALGDLTMYRFAVRHFADHDRAVVNDSVIASGSQVGVRWYELFDPAGTVTLNQQGTYAPDSTTYRWMASAAEDQNADLAIGFSASSSSIHPANRVAGRVPSDPAGTLESEVSIIEGGGSQTGLSRWGDYSALQVDPTDDCTFWYVAQYEAVTGSFNWHTRIGSFAFNGCGGGGGGPVVSLSTTKLTFAKTPIGQTSPSKSVTLTNTGTGTLNISSITISGDFIIQNNTCGAQVQAGANCKVTMAFTPTAKGARHGTLSFTDDAPGSPQTVSLTGTGQSLALSPNPVNYGTVIVGQSSTMAVTVKNVSTATVSLTGFSITGAITDYSITTNTCGASLNAGATCSISVKFAPTVKGKRSGMLNVFNNGGGSDSTDKLVGTGG